MPTVMLLPGLACDGDLWRDVLAALPLSAACRVADVHARFDTLDEMAAALLAENEGTLVLVGASMGGMVALAALRQAPRRIAGVALVGSTARPDTPELLALRSQAIELFAAGRMDEVLRANVPLAFHPANAGDTSRVGRYLAMVRRAGAQALIRQNRAVMARADARPALAGVRCPLLLLCGEADALTPPEHAREIAAAVPLARLEIIAGAGHLPTLEQPARVAALLSDWLSGLDG